MWICMWMRMYNSLCGYVELFVWVCRTLLLSYVAYVDILGGYVAYVNMYGSLCGYIGLSYVHTYVDTYV